MPRPTRSTPLDAGFSAGGPPERASGVPETDLGTAELPLAAEPASARTARLFCAATLERWGAAHVVSDCETVVSELVTNAVDALGAAAAIALDGPASPIVLRLRLTLHRLVCEVWDPAAGLPRQSKPGPDDVRGRGLLLVGALASGWTCSRVPSGGKVVTAFFLMPRPSGIG